MKSTRGAIISSLLTGTLLCVVTARTHAWEPNVMDLNGAITSGDFTQYLNNTSTWLNQQAPNKPSEAALAALLKNPAFALALAEWQLIAKTGGDKLPKPETATAIMAIAHHIEQSPADHQTDVTASLKPEEAEIEPTPSAKSTQATGEVSKRPIIVAPGATTHIDAAAFSSMSGVNLADCFTGGKQVNFQKNIDDSWVDFTLQVSTAGTYALTIKAAAANVDQVFHIKSGDAEPITVKVPWSKGLWEMTPAVDIVLKGRQTLRISAPFQRGIAMHHLELKSK